MEVNLEGIKGCLMTFIVDVNLDQFTPGLEYAWISICQLSMDRGVPGKLGQGIGYPLMKLLMDVKAVWQPSPVSLVCQTLGGGRK